MRCYICDRILDEPQYNTDHDGYEPCETCLMVIEDILAGFQDQPAAEEDAFGPDPIWEEYYPQILDPFPDD